MKYGIVYIIVLLLLGGCDQPEVQKIKENTHQEKKQAYLPPPPKKEIKLKDVNDTNFDADYMYPQTNSKKSIETSTQSPVVSNDTMDKAECIAMISQEKFDKYTAMFGSEEASIKRCKMLKAATL